MPAHDDAEVLGTWRGTSTCTDRVAAPACQDETVVYDFRRGDKTGSVVAKADKIVNGKREPMGELEFAYDTAELYNPRTGTWRATRPMDASRAYATASVVSSPDREYALR